MQHDTVAFHVPKVLDHIFEKTKMYAYPKKVYYIYVTEFWKITHMGTPETTRIFEFSMALLIAETTFENISKVYL